VLVVRQALAIVVAGIAVFGATFLATANLTLHGHYHCDAQGALPGSQCNLSRSYWVADRAAWQIPVAIVIAAVGLGAAILLARGKKSDPVQ
jgi:hypothetical protein